MFKPIKRLILKTRLNPKERSNLNLNLGNVVIDENRIKPDFQILEKYQNFSSEILRLSLIGVGAYAFLFKEIFAKKPEEAKPLVELVQKSPLNKYLIVAGIIFFAMAAACTLVHRYYSSDLMAFHIRYLRIKKYISDAHEIFEETPKGTATLEEAREEKEDRDVILQLCEFMIACSAIFLGLGVVCTAVALVVSFFRIGPA